MSKKVTVNIDINYYNELIRSSEKLKSIESNKYYFVFETLEDSIKKANVDGISISHIWLNLKEIERFKFTIEKINKK